jgi:diguanylate cyclase (GGDEF)-like protein/PAS domain S-box-containing protein
MSPASGKTLPVKGTQSSGRGRLRSATNAVRVFVRSRSVGTYLSLILAITIVPILAGCGLYLHYAWNEAITDAQSRSSVAAEKISADIYRQIRDRRDTLAEIASIPDIAHLNPHSCARVLNYYQRGFPELAIVTIRDVSSKVICSSRSRPRVYLNNEQKIWFDEALRANSFYITDAVRGPSTGRWVVGLTYPIRDRRHQVAAVMIFSLDLLTLNKRLLSGYPEEMLVAVQDRASNVIFRNTEPGNWIGHPLPERIRAVFRQGRSGNFRGRDIQNRKQIGSYVTVPLTNWVVAVGFPEDPTLAPAWSAIKRTTAIGSIGILILLLATAGMYRLVVRYCRALVTTAELISKGDDTARADHDGPKELAVVARQLNRMLDSLGERKVELLSVLKEKEEGEERYRLVLENAADAIVVVEPSGRYVYANHKAEELLGYSVSELMNMRSSDVVPLDQVAQAEARLGILIRDGHITREITVRRKDGSITPVELNAVSLPDGNYYGAMRDITERKALEARLEYNATHDDLTGLANRNVLHDRIQQGISRARRSKRNVVVMLLDLDGFKTINDTLLHEVGDKVLQEIATRLLGCVREVDTVARLGGDEFVIVLGDVADLDQVAHLVHELLDSVAQPIALDGHNLTVSGSIGVAVYKRDALTPSELLKCADIAMYKAKRESPGSFEFYSEELGGRIMERLRLENALRCALPNNELRLLYQPKVDVRENRITGAEALLRWKSEELGEIGPGDFIPVAEDTGMIVPIGDWVIRTACRQLRDWRAAGIRDIVVAINISPRQFQLDTIADTIREAIAEFDVPPELLKLEITESSVMTRPARSETALLELKQIGVAISLDDFGTGHSSLARLKTMPFDEVKVDQSFVRQLTRGGKDGAIVSLIIDLAHEMGQKVVAEGVETEEQLRVLVEKGCDEVQGFYYSPPLEPSAFALLLETGCLTKVG